jgi:hypothetical protein
MGMGGQCHTPATLPKIRYLLYRRLGGPLGQFEQVWKISPLGIRPPDHSLLLVVVIFVSLTHVGHSSVIHSDVFITIIIIIMSASFIQERSNMGKLFWSHYFILYFNIFSYFYLPLYCYYCDIVIISISII